MICEKCGKTINVVLLDGVRHIYSQYEADISEDSDSIVTINADIRWYGYNSSEEEQIKTIKCPYCKGFPFIDKDIRTYKYMKIICFKKNKE